MMFFKFEDKSWLGCDRHLNPPKFVAWSLRSTWRCCTKSATGSKFRGVGVIDAPSKGGLLTISLVHETYRQAHIAGIVSSDRGASPFIKTLSLGSGVDNAGHPYIENRATHTTSPSQFSLTFFGGFRGDAMKTSQP